MAFAPPTQNRTTPRGLLRRPAATKDAARVRRPPAGTRRGSPARADGREPDDVQHPGIPEGPGVARRAEAPPALRDEETLEPAPPAPRPESGPGRGRRPDAVPDPPGGGDPGRLNRPAATECDPTGGGVAPPHACVFAVRGCRRRSRAL